MATVRAIRTQAGPTPTPEELVDRARAMIPVLKARAKQCIADVKVPDASIADMQEAGFWKILQPRRWGGYEMNPNVFFDVLKLVSEGCMSTGWVLGVVGCHPYEIALMHDQAQRDVWGEDDSVLVSSSYQPVGKVEHADGGFHLTGRWGFSSGSEHCQWVLLGALIPSKDAGGPPEMRTFLVPRADYTIEKTWDTFGLRGTGSHDIVVDRAFVPDYRTHKAADGFLCTNPGQEENDGPLFSLPWAQIFLRSVSTAALGGTRAAVKAAVAIAEDRVSTNTGKVSKTDPILMASIAKAYAQMEEMELVLRHSFDDMMEGAAAGRPLTLERRAMNRYHSSTVVRRCADLVGEMLPLLGGRAIYMPWLDISAARAHVANDPNNMAGDVVGSLMGQPPTFMFM